MSALTFSGRILSLSPMTLSTTDFFAQNPGREKEFCTLTYTSMGIYDATAEQMADEAVLRSHEKGEELLDSVVNVLCERAAFAGGFLSWSSDCALEWFGINVWRANRPNELCRSR